MFYEIYLVPLSVFYGIIFLEKNAEKGLDTNGS